MAKRRKKRSKHRYGRRAVTRPQPKLQDVKFFMENAGCAKRPGETWAQAKRRCGVALAKAEMEARERGWEVVWEYDELPYEMGDAETEMPSEVLVAVLKDASGRVLASLGGIGDPSREYGRVVEAELADEALARIGHSVEPLP